MAKKIKTQPLKIGIDTHVRVRLTEFGWSIYEDYFSTNHRPKIVNGYLTMPLATLMNIFGTQLCTLPYDVRTSVFVDDEIIYDVPNLLVCGLAYQVEKDSIKQHQKWLEKQSKKMRGFKAGDKVVKTVGSDENIYTYNSLIPHMGSEAHEIISDSGLIQIVDFLELDYA